MQILTHNFQEDLCLLQILSVFLSKRESRVISFSFSAARSAMFEHYLIRCPTENQRFQLKKSTTNFKINLFNHCVVCWNMLMLHNDHQFDTFDPLIIFSAILLIVRAPGSLKFDLVGPPCYILFGSIFWKFRPYGIRLGWPALHSGLSLMKNVALNKMTRGNIFSCVNRVILGYVVPLLVFFCTYCWI